MNDHNILRTFEMHHYVRIAEHVPCLGSAAFAIEVKHLREHDTPHWRDMRGARRPGRSQPVVSSSL